MDLLPSHDWPQRIINAAPNAMLVVDLQGVIVFVNPAALSLFGYKREELLGEKIERLIPEELRREHGARVAGFFAEPRARAMGAGRELFGLSKEGAQIPVEIGLSPIDTPDGIFTLASIIDITEKRKLEAKLKTSTNEAQSAQIQLDAIFASTNAFVFSVDTNGLVQFINRTALRRREDVLGTSMFQLMSPDDQVRVKAIFRQVMETRAATSYELSVVVPDRPVLWYECYMSPMLQGDQVTGAVVVSHDITLRKKAEELQQQMTALVESAEDAIILKGADGTIRAWNPGAESLLGYRAEEVIGRTTRMLLPEDRFNEEFEIVAKINNGERVSHFESVRRRKDGSPVDVSLTISPIRDKQGQVIGSSKIMRDITARKQIEDDLRRSNADLEQFAYIASHDLQEPLRMVASYTTLLGERYRGRLDEKADKFIFYAVDGAKRMQRLITDLLAYSRVGSEGKPLAPVCVSQVLKRALVVLGASIHSAQAEVRVGELPEVCADELQLDQLFQNLIGNALKFRGEAPLVIEIGAKLQENRWVFSVKDNGIGIEMQYAERIFQMFQRLHERGKYEGSGIGLAIVKRIIERHGGKIWLESRLGVGTTFYFTLLPTTIKRI